jgi:hypothetical protein
MSSSSEVKRETTFGECLVMVSNDKKVSINRTSGLTPKGIEEKMTPYFKGKDISAPILNDWLNGEFKHLEVSFETKELIPARKNSGKKFKVKVFSENRK